MGQHQPKDKHYTTTTTNKKHRLSIFPGVALMLVAQWTLMVMIVVVPIVIRTSLTSTTMAVAIKG